MGASTENSKVAEVHRNGTTNGSANGVMKLLETEQEKKERTKSLIIVYFTLFLQSLGLAIAMTGVWPFLDKVNRSEQHC
jgi:hypothetical protein